MPIYLLLIPFCPLLAFVLTLACGRYWGERAHWLPIAGIATSLVCALLALRDVLGGSVVNADIHTWIASGNLRVTFGFLVDQLTAVMLVVVTSVSTLVHIYSVGYMRGEKGYYRFFAYLGLFSFSMLMLVMGNNFLQLFFGWEAVGLSSYLLIGFYYEKDSASDAGKKAFIVNRFGDFGFLLGLFCIFSIFGSLHYADVLPKAAVLEGMTFTLGSYTVSAPTLICLLLFCGAVGKSAQLPLHVWLPDAMEGPTPVSALIHAATMVTAGVFMLARCNALFALSSTALAVITVVGAITTLFAATIALTQTDIKRVVAYSTISQLAYMFIACGVGAYGAGVFHLFTHAFFKALLFLGCGSVILGMHHEQDMRSMGGLGKYMPVTSATFLLASLSIAGVPGLAGFFSKDEILLMAFNAGTATGYFAWGVGVLVAFMTAFYSFRLYFSVFTGEFRGTHHQREHLHESPLVVTVPLLVLAVGAVASGWLGIPHVLGGSNHWAEFLAPVTGHPHVHVSAAGELGLMAVSVAAGVAGIGLAWFMYCRRPELPGRVASAFAGLYRLFSRKYWVDEIYVACLVRPTLWLADKVLLGVVDTRGIEGVVNGVPRAIGRLSTSLRRLQDGQVAHYLTWMAGGVTALLLVLQLGIFS